MQSEGSLKVVKGGHWIGLNAATHEVRVECGLYCSSCLRLLVKLQESIQGVAGFL